MKSNLKIEIPSCANEIIHTLQNNGYEAFLVGGCVRDSILGRPIHDYDITTSATPDEMMEVFKDKRIIETGLDRKSTRLNSSHPTTSRMPSSA